MSMSSYLPYHTPLLSLCAHQAAKVYKQHLIVTPSVLPALYCLDFSLEPATCKIKSSYKIRTSIRNGQNGKDKFFFETKLIYIPNYFYVIIYNLFSI